MLTNLQPEAFQNLAIAWIGAITAAALALAAAVVRILPLIADIRARLDRHASAQQSIQQQLTQLAIATPTPASQPTPTTETK